MMTFWSNGHFVIAIKQKNQDRTDFDHDDNVKYADKLIQVHYSINNVQMHVAI